MCFIPTLGFKNFIKVLHGFPRHFMGYNNILVVFKDP